MWKFLRKLHFKWPHDPAVPRVGLYSKGIKVSVQEVPAVRAYYSTTHKSQVYGVSPCGHLLVESKEMHCACFYNPYVYTIPHTSVCFCHEECKYVICNKTGDPHHAKWNSYTQEEKRHGFLSYVELDKNINQTWNRKVSIWMERGPLGGVMSSNRNDGNGRHGQGALYACV